MAEKFSIGHQVDIGLPIGLFPLELLVHEKDSERQLLTVALLLAAEQLWVLLDDLAENGVLLCLLHREKHLVGHGDESLPVSNRLNCAHPDKPSLEVGWVFQLGHKDAIFLAPSVENLAFAHVLILPVCLLDLLRGLGTLSLLDFLYGLATLSFLEFLFWGLGILHRRNLL